MKGTKRTWRFRALQADAGAVMAGAASYQEAAEALGVHPSTIVRWAKDGKIPRPGGRRRARVSRRKGASCRGDLPRSPEGWARSVRRAYELSPSEAQLIDLGVRALELARDAKARPETQLAAAARFQSIMRQLDLPTDSGEKHGDTQNPETPITFPRRVG